MISNVSSPSKFWYFRQFTVIELIETFHHWSLSQKNTSLVIRVFWLMAAPFVWDHIGGIRYLRKWCYFKISCQIIPNPKKWWYPPPQVPASYDTRGPCDFAKAAMSVLCFHFFEAVDLVLVCSLPCIEYTVICLFSLWTIHTTMYFPQQAFLLL